MNMEIYIAPSRHHYYSVKYMENELDIVHVDDVLLEFNIDTRQQLCVLLYDVDRWQFAVKFASGKHQRPETVIHRTEH